MYLLQYATAHSKSKNGLQQNDAHGACDKSAYCCDRHFSQNFCATCVCAPISATMTYRRTKARRPNAVGLRQPLACLAAGLCWQGQSSGQHAPLQPHQTRRNTGCPSGSLATESQAKLGTLRHTPSIVLVPVPYLHLTTTPQFRRSIRACLFPSFAKQARRRLAAGCTAHCQPCRSDHGRLPACLRNRLGHCRICRLRRRFLQIFQQQSLQPFVSSFLTRPCTRLQKPSRMATAHQQRVHEKKRSIGNDRAGAGLENVLAASASRGCDGMHRGRDASLKSD